MAAKNLTTDQFQTWIQKEKKPALVEFWAPWCSYCRRIGPAYAQVADQYRDKLLVAQVNVDEEAQLADQYHIETIPALLFFRDGRPVASVVAPESKASIETFLRENC